MAGKMRRTSRRISLSTCWKRVRWAEPTRSVAGSEAFYSGHLTISWPMRPNAPAPANEEATASLFTWTMTRRKTVTNSRRR